MLDLFKSWGTHCIIHTITFIQLTAIIEFFLERKLKLAKSMGYSLMIILLNSIAVICFQGTQWGYKLWINVLMIGIFYKGRTIYKILVILNAIVFNMVAEDLTYLLVAKLNLDGSNKIMLQFISMGIILIISFGIVYIFKDIHTKQRDNVIPKIELLTLLLVDVLSISGYGLGCLLYDGKIQLQNNSVFYSVFVAIILMINTGILVVVNRGRRNQYYLEVNRIIEKKLAYYESLEKSNKEIRGIKHDMQNHLMSIAGLLKDGDKDNALEYTQNICSKINDNTNVVQTGNSIVDVILNEKYRVAKENNICMQIDGILPKELCVDMIDLCILFSNSLDNALEACMKVKDCTQRKINIFTRINQGYLVFRVTNTVMENVRVRNNKIKTSKNNWYEHGYGIDNMERVVKKYKGELKLESENYTFKLEVIINTI